ncbi:AraC family transcriptional regulator [Brucella pseudogrignonensis]|uniref:AraC family transcriptional regulator n=1 Tax=Brucella pseudogrignonensis TaxID=419475 RepID=UPI001ED9C9A6|nr:AraC family transcriptional regulator [Brucella pseudogrignonensis]UKK94684.1 AraC family transcriptional regulator [Brucella pseudogrignonensis]
MTDLPQLTKLIARHMGEDGMRACALPGVTLIRASAPTLPMPALYQPTLCLIAQGRKEAGLGPLRLTYDPSSFLLASVDLPVMGAVIEASRENPYLCMQLSLDMTLIGELTLQFPAPVSRPAQLGLSVHRASAGLLGAAGRLLALLDTPDDIAALAPLTLREIFYRLLRSSAGPALRQFAQADSHLSQIARAIAWIRENFRGACPIDHVAQLAGMSRSAFHDHFRAITGLSPLAFRAQLRMQEAQRLMLTTGMVAADAGFAVGYGSPSQFSRDYARQFGAPPARHAAELRKAAA